MQRDIPDPAVEAAARGVYTEIRRRINPFGQTWDELTEEERQESKAIARAALAAALPHLAAAEREACAQLADDVASPSNLSAPDGRDDDWCHGWQDGAMEAAAAIRARGDLPPDLMVRQMPGETP